MAGGFAGVDDATGVGVGVCVRAGELGAVEHTLAAGWGSSPLVPAPVSLEFVTS